MQIRPATVEDAETIERIRIRGWQIGYRHVFPPEELDLQVVDWSRWVEWFASPPHGQVCFVAEDADGMFGWATVGASGFPDELGELHGLYVDPERWGQGAGRALLVHGEAWLAQTWENAILWTLADNPRARRFYEAAGWRVDGLTGTFDRFGVRATVVRYAKLLSCDKSTTSRS